MNTMFPRITSGNPPTNLEAVQEFECKVGFPLPRLYKEFLLETNGGRPRESVFPIDGFAHNPFGSLHEFFGLGARPPLADLDEIFEWFKNGVPAGIIAIGRTDGADYLCLDLRDGQEQVRYWDHRHHWGTGEWRESDLYHVANSFEEFIASLRPDA